MKSKKLSSYGPKTLIFTNLTNNVKNTCYLAITPSIFRFHQNKKKMAQLLVPSPTTFVSYYSTSDEDNFFGLSADILVLCL